MKFLKYVTLISIFFFIACNSDDDEPVITPQATVTSISPTNGPKTTIVNINGQDFGNDINKVTVYFNNVEAIVHTITNTKITAEVPPRAFTGNVKIIVNGVEIEAPIFTYTVIDIQVSTFAGSGTDGSIDGTGSTAQFGTLGQIAMDSNGNIYVADSGNHIIRKITPSGVVSTFAGSTPGFSDGTGTTAQFNRPFGIAVDDQDNIYVNDSDNTKIRKITPNGVVSTLAGSSSGFADGQGADAKFNGPFGLAIDAENNLYVADYYNNRIRKITPSGEVSTFAGSGTSGNVDGQGINAQFNNPIGITVDLNGNIYVGDESSNNIRKIASTGEVTTLAGSSSGFADGQGVNAQFRNLTGLASDKQGNIYAADYFNNRIRKITPTGLVTTFTGSTAGATNGTGATAQFENPYDVIVDSNYDVYVADRGNYRIRKITQE